MNNIENNMEKYKGVRVAVLTAGPTTGVVGGAERLYIGLLDGLRKIGCEPHLIFIPADEPNFETIKDNYKRCADLDLSEFDVVISTKAPTFVVNHPCHVMYLIHTIRVFDDMFENVFDNPQKEHYEHRAYIHRLDYKAINKVKARFSIGHEVADRLFRWRGISAEVLYPPLGVSGFLNKSAEDYFFLPGRLHKWKRVDLVIKAVLKSKLPLKLVIAGTGEAEQELRELAGSDERIKFLGRIDDNQLIDYYARALAVPFVPEREDYGYITLEAFASGKPVLTCIDSGEPSRIVVDGFSGFIRKPEPQEICNAMEFLFENKEVAEKMGKNGLDFVSGMKWEKVASTILDAALEKEKLNIDHSLNITVFDMQPIDPPVGGGRLRLLGLYHDMGEDIECTYIGSYDWPGEKFRKHYITPRLQEIDIPLSEEHHAAAANLSQQVSGKTVIDISFSRLGKLSEDYINKAIEKIRTADVVVFSHPWVFPLLENYIQPCQTVVYDAQNVEGFLRAQFLDESNSIEHDLLYGVVKDEVRLCRRADLIFACSDEDAFRFNRLYKIEASRLRVVPNGVMAFSNPVPTEEERQLVKKKLGIERWEKNAIFIGSAYGPNVEAAEFILEKLAPKLPSVLFVIAGGVGGEIHSNLSNVKITGPLSEASKALWLSASDIAVNPMFSGSGTNIKMFDFMAFGLPIITTNTGARGIGTFSSNNFLTVSGDEFDFLEAFKRLEDKEFLKKMSENARRCVEEYFSWEKISKDAGRIIKARHKYINQPLPLFSIIISTKEIENNLSPLFEALSLQVERDFEVIVVDRGRSAISYSVENYGFPLNYISLPNATKDKANKVALDCANGKFIVNFDTDLEFSEYWLLDLRGVVTGRGGAEKFIAWFPSKFKKIPNLSPLVVVRNDALRLCGGFNWSEITAGDHDGIYSRLSGIGNVSFISELDLNYSSILNKKIAIISTIGHKCGIGEYSSSLVDAFYGAGYTLKIISCETSSGGNPSTNGRQLAIGWFYDDLEYKNSKIHPETLELIGVSGISMVIIQYHPAFFGIGDLVNITIDLISRGILVIVDNHKYRPEDISGLSRVSEAGAIVFFHKRIECNAAFDFGVQAYHSPLGVYNRLPYSKRNILGRDWIKNPPILVTTGFLRRHKGVRTLIEAMPLIIREFPGCKLRIQCAKYPSVDSLEELDFCNSLIDELKISQNVDLDSDFYEKNEMLGLISDADIALLAYDQSEEGGSAAAADCFSVGLPLLVSGASIFEDIREYSCVVKGDSSQWAKEILRILKSPREYSEFVNKAYAYVENNSWDKVVRNFVRFFNKV